MSDKFLLFWETYKSTPARDMIVKSVVVDGQPVMLNHLLQHCWNDNDHLPEPLRKEIIAELQQHRPAHRTVDGRQWPDPGYWRDRIWRVSQAAQALRPLVARKMVNPRLYPPPTG